MINNSKPNGSRGQIALNDAAQLTDPAQLRAPDGAQRRASYPPQADADAGDLYGDYQQDLVAGLTRRAVRRPMSNDPLDVLSRQLAEQSAAAVVPPSRMPAGQASPGGALATAVRPRNDFAEDDDDDLPLPYSWRHEPRPPEPSWLRRQVRYVGMGCAGGLAIVVPAVLMMTGHMPEPPSFQQIRHAALGVVEPAPVWTSDAPRRSRPAASASTTMPPVGMDSSGATRVAPRSDLDTTAAASSGMGAGADVVIPKPASRLAPVVSPSDAAAQPRDAEAAGKAAIMARSVTTTDVFPNRSSVVAAVPPPSAPAPVPVVDPNLALVEEGQRLLRDGQISAARGPLSQAAAGGNSQAMLALGETFDPNILAAWGAPRDVKPDVATAKLFYGRALAAGVTAAQKRLELLR